MERRGLSLAEIQEVPKSSLILIAGAPGAGKSTFGRQVVLNALAIDRPVMFVTTEQTPAEVVALLSEKGMGEPPAGALSFVDAFAETVGLATSGRADTIGASCESLNSISMAIARLQQRIDTRDILLVFDSLTSPYLFNKGEMFRFLRLSLARFAAEGNSVLALMDEGCGKEEDLVAMMSVCDGVIKIEVQEDGRLVNVIKHPEVGPARIIAPMTPSVGLDARIPDPALVKRFVLALMRGKDTAMLREAGDYVNLFWPSFAHWSGMLCDPRGFPAMTYELNKDDYPSLFRLVKKDEEVMRALFPWRFRLLLRLAPKDLDKVKAMRRVLRSRSRTLMPERVGIMEYLEDVSTAGEHYVRVYESSDCWGFENVGATMASYLPPLIAGMCGAIESYRGRERDWNAVETKCVGLADPYCEFKLVPGKIDGLKGSLEKDSSVIERIHERLMQRLMGFLLEQKPLAERPRLGSEIQLHPVYHAMAFPPWRGSDSGWR